MIPGVFSLKAVVIAAVAAWMVGMGGGVWVTAKVYGYRNAQVVIKQLRTDLKATQDQAKANSQHAEELAAANAGNMEKIRDLETSIGARKPDDRCPLSVDDAGRLRGFR